MVEHFHGKEGVTSSNLVVGSSLPREIATAVTRRRGACETTKEGRRNHGEGKIRANQTACERGNHRPRGPRQDHPHQRDYQGAEQAGTGQGNRVRPDRQGARRERARHHDLDRSRGI